MAEIKLRIEQLVLDNDNPRITHSDSQQQTLQKVVKSQRMKLVRLAESIVEHGLSPVDRLMIMEINVKPKRYIALEGNRRVAVLILLNNPASMTGLTMLEGMQRPLEKLASIFTKSKIEPIPCHEVGTREEGKYWIELRHNGENDGRGVVGWKPIVAARFRNKDATIQAFDLVMDHGGFEEDVAEEIRSKFPLSTFKRLIDTKEVRSAVGLDIKDGLLVSSLPGAELIKPLKKMVVDISNKVVDSRKFNKTQGMLDYIGGFAKNERPDLSKKVAERSVEGIDKAEFVKPTTPKAKARSTAASPAERKHVVPKGCSLNVTDNRIADIYLELKTLKLDAARNAVAVLTRVFLELSIDHFLEKNGVSLSSPKPGGGEIHKKLDKKLTETVDKLVATGVPRRHFSAITRSLSVKTSPMNVDLFHLYVHDRFASPSPTELKAAWDHAQPLFEKIWP